MVILFVGMDFHPWRHFLRAWSVFGIVYHEAILIPFILTPIIHVIENSLKGLNAVLDTFYWLLDQFISRNYVINAYQVCSRIFGDKCEYSDSAGGIGVHRSLWTLLVSTLYSQSPLQKSTIVCLYWRRPDVINIRLPFLWTSTNPALSFTMAPTEK